MINKTVQSGKEAELTVSLMVVSVTVSEIEDASFSFPLEVAHRRHLLKGVEFDALDLRVYASGDDDANDGVHRFHDDRDGIRPVLARQTSCFLIFFRCLVWLSSQVRLKSDR